MCCGYQRTLKHGTKLRGLPSLYSYIPDVQNDNCMQDIHTIRKNYILLLEICTRLLQVLSGLPSCCCRCLDLFMQCLAPCLWGCTVRRRDEPLCREGWLHWFGRLFISLCAPFSLHFQGPSRLVGSSRRLLHSCRGRGLTHLSHHGCPLQW